MKTLALLLLAVAAACASQAPLHEPGIRVRVIARRPMESGISGGIVGASYHAPDGFVRTKPGVSLHTRRTP